MDNKLRQSIVHEKFQSKKVKRDNFSKITLIVISSLVMFLIVSIFITFFAKGISGFFTFDALRIGDFLFGNYYNPTSAAFAAGFMVINTLWISFLALVISVPISIFTALFVTKVVPKKFKGIFYVTITILAAIPSVIYGAFGLFIIDSVVRNIFNVGPGTALSVIITLAFMIMPTITIITIASLESVDKKMQHSSLALGATKMQTSILVTLKAASKGILVAILLGLGRALGEATAVSMVASQSSYGPTFNPLGNIALITANMLQGFPEVASGSVEQASFFAMASLLMITILIVFSSMKQVEKRIDIEYKSKKSSELLVKKHKVYEKVQNEGIISLETKELDLYIKEQAKQKLNSTDEQLNKLNYEIANIMNRNTYKSNSQIKVKKYKRRQTNIFKALTYIFSLFGIFLLLSIVVFLFNGGVGVLNWNYISSSGIYDVVDNQNIYGLSTALFGTVFTIVIALAFAIPAGIMIAILLSVYLKKNSRFGNFLSIVVQFLTGVPSLIYGIIGSIIFVPLFSNGLIKMNSLSAAFTISLFILPTILKTTQEGFESIPKSQKSASLSLGATNYITTKRILIKQAFPSIISSAVLASGIIIADSAIFITIYGSLSQSSSMGWIQNGGTTLASEIYKLTKQEVILWDYVKAIGIVIVALIILISILASYVKNENWTEGMTIFIGMLLMLIGIFSSLLSIFIIGLLLVIFIIVFVNIWKFFDKKYQINKKVKSKIYEWKVGV